MYELYEIVVPKEFNFVRNISGLLTEASDTWKGLTVGKSGEKLPQAEDNPFHIRRLTSMKIPSIRYTITPFAEYLLQNAYDEIQPDIIHSHFMMYRKS